MMIDYSPVKECKHPELTYGEICVKCGECDRFDKPPFVQSEIHIVEQYYQGIPSLWTRPETYASFFRGIWSHYRSIKNHTSEKAKSGNLTEILPPSWLENPPVRWWIEGRNW